MILIPKKRPSRPPSEHGKRYKAAQKAEKRPRYVSEFQHSRKKKKRRKRGKRKTKRTMHMHEHEHEDQRKSRQLEQVPKPRTGERKGKKTRMIENHRIDM
ncbi:hypothetical protein GYMLUDRAFT_413691 [Collybiopsis luxurians FD-317 M1]|nr:hypothetical protein GYMLUDRAFT_413691 [Collybiopsis luxurians FD-317 M1]